MGPAAAGAVMRAAVVGLVVVVIALALSPPLAAALRPIRERVASAGASAAAGSWGDEHAFFKRDENDLSPYSWNITGTYKGSWSFAGATNGSSRFIEFVKSKGNSVLELLSTPTKISGVHYVQGSITFHDVIDNGHDRGVAQIRLEGVYIWPFRQLRMVANSGADGEPLQEEDYFLSNPYHLLRIFSSQVFQESSEEKNQRKNSLTYDMEKHCNTEITAKVVRVSSNPNGEHEKYRLEGLMESPPVDDDGECFSPILLNATSLNVEVYYNKAVNYTLMVTFISFLQVLLLIRQMEHSNTQSGAAKVSILMIGQQAIMDAYLCLLHLTAGILVESLFNAFATAAFFKFVIFSIFEMRYLLAIWKASRPLNSGEGWEIMRRELSVLYSRFYGILLGGILLMYELHNFLRPLLLLMYSFWVPQIVTNVIRDTRKPLHPQYILGMTVTRLAIPLYIFGCPNNFMRIDPDKKWCIAVTVFMGIQAAVLLLQHYLGSRCFIPRQILPEKYCYHRKVEDSTNQPIDCVICMTTIDLTQRTSEYMVAPCEHIFHSGCLQRWMDIKMECPTCRRSLPPA
ncbi:transmembrane E3 ubiquitin-protein ligase FLY2-like isoform X2 [Phragmites australis]|uniref:transmembrane E3 ubiquitin-protein ligase FLY2-like isoform X2 n=1 Tax=Phragmites australis TaxID=29695 RepID=UPI002D78735B|nr:transmembrane E3 ubiquitin-protein ligase FLY2-like isoform X2 [Phragmites australis]